MRRSTELPFLGKYSKAKRLTFVLVLSFRVRSRLLPLRKDLWSLVGYRHIDSYACISRCNQTCESTFYPSLLPPEWQFPRRSKPPRRVNPLAEAMPTPRACSRSARAAVCVMNATFLTPYSPPRGRKAHRLQGCLCVTIERGCRNYMRHAYTQAGGPSSPQTSKPPIWIMLSERLSAWFGADHGGVVKDVLSGKERILPLVDVRRYPCRTLSACHFAALNFVRVAFKHMQRTRGGSSPSMARWLGALMDRHVLEVCWFGDVVVDGGRSSRRLVLIRFVALFRRYCLRASS